MATTTTQAELPPQPNPSDNAPSSINEGENTSSSEGIDLSRPHEEKFTAIELSNNEPSSSVPTVTAPRQFPPTASASSHNSAVATNPPQQPQQNPPTQFNANPNLQSSQTPQYSSQPPQYPQQAPQYPPQQFQGQHLQHQQRQPTPANVLPTASGGIQIGRNGNNFNLKQWSTTTYRYAKQVINERIGRGTRTFDAQLEGQIQGLRDTQFKYSSLLRLIKQYIVQFRAVLITQSSLGDSFADLAIRSVDLESEFSSNAKTQKAILDNGETMLAAMNFVVSSLTTLCDKTMTDTLETVKFYENARIEYDAIRNDVESYPEANQSPRAISLRHEFSSAKEKFEKLRNDVSIKLKFLEENKVKVMHKQLVLFHDAFCAYFSGNKDSLQALVRDFHLKLATEKTVKKPSFLENS